MPDAIPEQFLDLLATKKAFGHLGTLMPDGSPQVTPVWFDYASGILRINSARGRQKDRNIRRDSRVALCIIDPDNPYRYLEIRGRILEITEQGADAHINSLAHKYLGVDVYPYRQPGEVRVMYRIEIQNVHGNR